MDGLIALSLAKKYADSVGQSIISAGFRVQVEQDRSILETTGEEKVLYLLPKASSNLSNDDGYDEFVYANNKWEWVGKTDVDLDYEELSNKPTIRYFNTQSGNYVSIPFIGEIRPNDEIAISKNGNLFNIGVYETKVFTAKYVTDLYLNNTPRRSCVMSAKAQNIHGLPNFVQSRNNSDVTVIQFAGGRAANGGTDIATCLQILLWFDDSYNTHYAKRMYDSSVPHGFFDWEEIGSGAQIVSGVVNANGTITFTDSDGNTFNTTGSNLVTSGNEQINVGYDNGGFYFLFDDGQEGE